MARTVGNRKLEIITSCWFPNIYSNLPGVLFTIACGISRAPIAFDADFTITPAPISVSPVAASRIYPQTVHFFVCADKFSTKKTAQAAANNFRIKFYNLLGNKLGKICDRFLRMDSFQKKECIRHSTDEKSK